MEQAESAAALRETQRALRALITAPSGAGAEGTQRAEALLRGDARRPIEARLAVYTYAWLARLKSALADDFPALAQALGEPAWGALVRAYLQARPPSRPSLRDAGASLPEFLAADPAAAEARRRAPFAPDLARFEWALVEAFDAADAPALARDALAGVAPERWAELRFAFPPALALLALAWPAERLRAAHDRGEEPPALPSEPEPTQVCVWRADERVFYRALDPLEAEALARARGGASFGELCEALADRIGEAEAPAHAAALLARWQSDGWLAGLAGDASGPAAVC